MLISKKCSSKIHHDSTYPKQFILLEKVSNINIKSWVANFFIDNHLLIYFIFTGNHGLILE